MTLLTVHNIEEISHTPRKVRNDPNCEDYDSHELVLEGVSLKEFTTITIFTPPGAFPENLINTLSKTDTRALHTVKVNGFNTEVLLNEYSPEIPAKGMDGAWEDSSPAEAEVIDFIPATGTALLDQYIEEDINVHESIREQLRDLKTNR